MSFYRWIKLQHLKTFHPDICLAWLVHRRHWSRAVVTSLQLITFEIEFWLSCSNRCHSQICFPLPPASPCSHRWRQTKALLACSSCSTLYKCHTYMENVACDSCFDVGTHTFTCMPWCYIGVCTMRFHQFTGWKYLGGRNHPWTLGLICNCVHEEHAVTPNVSFITFLSILLWSFPISLPLSFYRFLSFLLPSHFPLSLSLSLSGACQMLWSYLIA